MTTEAFKGQNRPLTKSFNYPVEKMLWQETQSIELLANSEVDFFLSEKVEEVVWGVVASVG